MKKIVSFDAEIVKKGEVVRVSILIEGTCEYGENAELMQNMTVRVQKHGDEILDSLLKYIGWLK